MANGTLDGEKSGYSFEYGSNSRHCRARSTIKERPAIVAMIDEWLSRADLGRKSPWLIDPSTGKEIDSSTLSIKWWIGSLNPRRRASGDTYGVALEARPIDGHNTVYCLVQTGNNTTRRPIAFIFPFNLINPDILSRDYFYERLREVEGSTNDVLRASRDNRSIRREGEEMPQLVTPEAERGFREILLSLAQQSSRPDYAIRLVDYHDATRGRFNLNRLQSRESLNQLEQQGLIERKKGAHGTRTLEIYYNPPPQPAGCGDLTSNGNGKKPVTSVDEASVENVAEQPQPTTTSAERDFSISDPDTLLFTLHDLLGAPQLEIDGGGLRIAKSDGIAICCRTWSIDNARGKGPSFSYLHDQGFLVRDGDFLLLTAKAVNFVETNPIGNPIGLPERATELLGRFTLDTQPVEMLAEAAERPVSAEMNQQELYIALAQLQGVSPATAKQFETACRLSEELELAKEQLPIAEAEVERLKAIVEDECHLQAFKFVTWLKSLK